MTVEELYDKLQSPGFQNTEEGDLFYNFYIYLYDAEKEYEIRKQIRQFKENLIRPTSFVDVLTLNLYEAFCEFMDGLSFGKKHPSYLKYLFDKGVENQDAVMRSLTTKANSKEFYEYIHQRILTYISDETEYKRPYVFLYGIGQMYPLLRTNVFLTNYEAYNEVNKYKMIVFYPGKQEENTFSLFGCLEDVHTYRATLLIND